ncbi:MAG: sigma-70 family RNA polymerase sigma factor [Candidatus Spechtbacterales bacterium]
MTHSHEQQFLHAYRENADAIFRHCFFRVSDKEMASDLMQETFLRTWKYLTNGNTVENIRALLYRIANNLIVDYYRRRKVVSLDGLLEQAIEPARVDGRTLMNTQVDRALAVKALDKLPEHYRQVIVMRYIDELSVQEMASILAETENAVSVRLHRALKKCEVILTSHDTHNDPKTS